MTRSEYLLSCLAEECAEVIQRVTKAQRFGLQETQPEQPLTNAERIQYELADLSTVVEMLYEEGLLPDPDLEHRWEEMRNAKRAKIKKYMDYSVECGALER